MAINGGKRMFVIVATVVAMGILVAWIGLRVAPSSFDRFPRSTATPQTVAFPEGQPGTATQGATS